MLYAQSVDYKKHFKYLQNEFLKELDSSVIFDCMNYAEMLVDRAKRAENNERSGKDRLGEALAQGLVDKFRNQGRSPRDAMTAYVNHTIGELTVYYVGLLGMPFEEREKLVNMVEAQHKIDLVTIRQAMGLGETSFPLSFDS